MTLVLSNPTGPSGGAGRILRILTVAFVQITGLQGPLDAASAAEHGGPGRHPAAVDHAPFFVTPPGETDILLVVMTFVLIGAVLLLGVFFFWLHSLPERLVHNSTKLHFDIVAVLALLSLFTHIHLFWVAALLIALVRIPTPDFTGKLGRIAGSLERMADTTAGKTESAAPPSPPPRLNVASNQASEQPAPRRMTHA